MGINPKIFKAYDIRGLCPGELDENTAYRVGQALVEFTKAKTVVVGNDMRGTTPGLFIAFARGVMSQGADVVDVGMVTTPMLYFAVGSGVAAGIGSGTVPTQRGLSPSQSPHAGAMITASHNPKEYNGIKLCYGDALPIGGESGMAEIRDIALAGPLLMKAEGKMAKADIRKAYVDRLFSVVEPGRIARLRVVADGGNGMEGRIIGDIFSRLRQGDFHGLFLEPDGTFPNHEANPLKEETLDALKKKMGQVGADIGFAFDGDGDRIGVVDERGETIPGDLLTALIAPLVLRDAPGAAVLYDVRSSLVAAEEIAKSGGRPVMCRVGHGLIKPRMREEDAVFAGELSNHFYFRDMYGAESSDLLMLLLLALVSEQGKPLSQIVAPLRRYAQSGEINSEVADKEETIARIRAAYAHEASKEVTIDGIRLEFLDEARPERDWWFSVRQSNTEPLLRLNVEARVRGRMEEKRDELLGLIRRQGNARSSSL